MIKALLEAEIPVMGHLGLTPQSINVMGGHRVQGKSVDAAYELIDDAKALAAAGVFALVLEGIPDTLARIITQEIPIPTIGIGAGVQCDGQVLVFHDLLGLLFTEHRPKFVRQYVNLGEIATEAIQRYCADVLAGVFPADGETYHMNEQVRQELLHAYYEEKPIES
jgi:3-methyl-2-oxobutanoate hydroxymethyltransferase